MFKFSVSFSDFLKNLLGTVSKVPKSYFIISILLITISFYYWKNRGIFKHKVLLLQKYGSQAWGCGTPGNSAGITEISQVLITFIADKSPGFIVLLSVEFRMK